MWQPEVPLTRAPISAPATVCTTCQPLLLSASEANALPRPPEIAPDAAPAIAPSAPSTRRAMYRGAVSDEWHTGQEVSGSMDGCANVRIGDGRVTCPDAHLRSLHVVQVVCWGDVVRKYRTPPSACKGWHSTGRPKARPDRRPVRRPPGDRAGKGRLA